MGASLISARQLTPEFLEELFRLADEAWAELQERALKLAEGKLMATLFYEPSTRTRLSFESAMLRLGGQVLGFTEAKSSSAAKGETLADTVRVVAGYADLVVMRHPLDGAARLAVDYVGRPFINAGDGRHEHPTQTLTDLYTLHRKGLYKPGLKVGLVGDLKYGRTVHSLVKALEGTGAELYCAAPKALKLPVELAQEAQAAGLSVYEVETLEALLPEVEIVYMTRIQKERLAEDEDYEALRGAFVLTGELVKLNPEVCILHPLPRVDEITPDVDETPAAAYFEQAANGVPVRMALVELLLGIRGESELLPAYDSLHRERAAKAGEQCLNPRCVVRNERFAPPKVYEDEAGRLRCSYCDNLIE